MRYFLLTILILISITAHAQFGNFKAIRLVNGDSISAGAMNGSIYYDRTLNKFRFYENGAWKPLGGTFSTPGSDTQVILNQSGSFGASANFTYDATNNISNISYNLTKIGPGARSNDFYRGIDHIDSVASGNSNGFNLLDGEHHTVANNGSSGSTLNNSFLFGGYKNSLRIKSGTSSVFYNSGIMGGQNNYMSVSNGFLGSSAIVGGIANRISINGVTRKGMAIIGGEKNIVSGNHSIALGGYAQNVTDSATVAVPSLQISSKPAIADTTGFVLAFRSSDGKAVRRHVSSISGGSTSLGTITDDPFNYPASGNTLDTFGGRSSGKLKSVFGDYSLPTVTGLNMKIVSDGNSNSVGYNLPAGQDYPTQVYNALGGSGAGYSIVNFGVSGQTTQDMQSDAATQIDPAYNSSKTKNFLFAWEVENDVFVNSVSGATAATNMLNYWSGRKSTGFYVIGATSPLRGNNVLVNSRIKTANTALLAGTSNYDAIVDIPSIPMLSNVRGSGFQSDFTHFTYSGVLALRDAYVSKVRAALSQQDYTPPNFMSWNGNTPDRSMIVGPTNSNALSFITNGKIRAEVTPNGSLTSVGDVTAVGGLGIGLTVNPGLTASANNDNLMTALFKPAYFDKNGKTGIVKDIVQFRDSANVIQSRWDDRGRFFLQPTFTALNNNDQGSIISGTTTGYSSGTFTGVSIAPTHNYAANSTRFTAVDISPTASVGSYTGTITTVLKVNAGAFVTSADKALEIDANDGVGLYINHGGGTYAANISSSTSGTIAAIGGTNGSALALNCYKIDGTGQTALFQNLTGSSVSSTIPIITLSRPVTINNGGGIAFPYIMGSSTGSIRTAGQSSAYWIDNTNTSETGGMKWETMQSGTLSEGMKLEGKNLTVDGTITATGGSYITPTSQAGGRNLAIADNGTLIVTSNSSPISITIPTGLAVGFNCKVAQGSSGAVTVSGAGGTTIVGGTAGTAITTNAGDIVEVYCTGTNTYLINLH